MPSSEAGKALETARVEPITPMQVAQEQPSPGRIEENDRYSVLYQGTVELAVPPPVGLNRMLQLHKHLKQTPKLEVMNLGGSVDKGITIRLHLETPTPLLKILEDLDEVKNASDEIPGADRLVPSRQGGEEGVKRVIVLTND